MNREIRVLPIAEQDISRAHDWYEEQRQGLGQVFSTAVESAVTRITAMPEMYVKALRDIRRAKVRKFPYLIYYRILSDPIEMIAVLHGSRDPHLWRERIN